MRKLKFNKRNIRKLILGLGLGGVLTTATVNARPYVDFNTGDFGLAYVNTKNIHLSSEDFLEEFNKIYNNSEVLQKEWADVYPTISDFILKYGDKLDQEEILDTLGTLKFEEVDLIQNDKIMAAYDFYTNTIKYNKKINYKSDEDIKELKTHEAFHYLFHQHFYKDPINIFGLGLELDEGVVSELVREYDIYSDQDLYKKNTLYLKTICEIIGKDKFMECLGNHSFIQLVDSLAEYSSITDAVSLIMKIDKAARMYNSYGTDADKSAWEIIEKMYQNKNGYSIEDSDDMVMKSYSNNLARTNYHLLNDNEYYSCDLHTNYFINTDSSYIELMKDGEIYDTIYIDNTDEIKTR